ncbi:Mitochodrial transcription termination factor [Vigna unguiculata]|uniref:Mitochodrial transcription termination factor n=1 Tax=Vigna unguiculata TaxID=3917 RepID=A0A4D6LPI4_VIGUN|nr:Mitochodrial transcription termination factor [Vigna unguiculata]
MRGAHGMYGTAEINGSRSNELVQPSPVTKRHRLLINKRPVFQYASCHEQHHPLPRDMSIVQLSPTAHSQFSSHPNPPTTSDRGILFHEKVRYLKALKVNPEKAFHLNPTLRSSPLAALESVTRCLYSLRVPRAALGRILDMHPVLLTCDPYSQLYPLLDFLLHEVPIPFPDVHLCILRCPRLLVSSIDDQLRPTLFFLRELGFCGPHSLTCQTTLLLVSSLEDTLLPKIEFLKSLGFTHIEVSNMVVRSPGLLTLSVKKNLMPKLEFFLKEMNGDVAELKRFPQYFSFSLERRIRSRFGMLRQLGVSMPLEDMLKVSDGEFNARLLELRFKTLEFGVGQ